MNELPLRSRHNQIGYFRQNIQHVSRDANNIRVKITSVDRAGAVDGIFPRGAKRTKVSGDT